MLGLFVSAQKPFLGGFLGRWVCLPCQVAWGLPGPHGADMTSHQKLADSMEQPLSTVSSLVAGSFAEAGKVAQPMWLSG